MGPGFSDSEEEEKETAPKDNTVESFAPEMPIFPSRCKSDNRPVNEETEDNRTPPGQSNHTVDNSTRFGQFSGIHVIQVVESFEEQKRVIK